MTLTLTKLIEQTVWEEARSLPLEEVVQLIEAAKAEGTEFNAVKARLGHGAHEEARFHLQKMWRIVAIVNESRLHNNPSIAQIAEQGTFELLYIYPLPDVFRVRAELQIRGVEY